MIRILLWVIYVVVALCAGALTWLDETPEDRDIWAVIGILIAMITWPLVKPIYLIVQVYKKLYRKVEAE